MDDAPARTVFDVVTDFLASRPSDEEVLVHRLPAGLQARVDALAEIKTNSRLTAAQREELGDFRFAEEVMSRLKSKIGHNLQQSESGSQASAPKCAASSDSDDAAMKENDA